MAEQPDVPGTAPVTDHRPVPRGVLPRRMQTWLMAGLACGILAIILLAGQPKAPVGPTTAAAAPQATNPELVRQYQDRLRALEAQALHDAQAASATPAQTPPAVDEQPQTPPSQDPIKAERRRRRYESLFASNVVLSRRPSAERPEPNGTSGSSSAEQSQSAGPSIDQIADAVVRATARAGGAAAPGSTAQLVAPAAPAVGKREVHIPEHPKEPRQTGPISDAGPLHRLLEGTIIDTVLTNRLSGDAAGPVNLLVTNPVYSHSDQYVLIPAGARILGDTKPVQSQNDTRLAVALHRLVMPDGRTYSLDQFPALNQIGDAGLSDQVNHHYWSIFGAAGAVGLISGLTQWLGTAGFTGGTGNRTVIIAGGATDATAQAAMQAMNRFLNRLPTVTIREGHRVKVYLTSDLELPAFASPVLSSRF